MSKRPLPPHVLERRRMARLKAAGSTALSLIALLLLAAPWLARYALHWSADDSVALGMVTCFVGLPIGALAAVIICDAAHGYNDYRRSIDKLHWKKHQKEQEGSVVTAARKRKLFSLVHGETSPYAWAVYRGEVPLKRFIRQDDAWSYFIKLVEGKCDPF